MLDILKHQKLFLYNLLVNFSHLSTLGVAHNVSTQHPSGAPRIFPYRDPEDLQSGKAEKKMLTLNYSIAFTILTFNSDSVSYDAW